MVTIPYIRIPQINIGGIPSAHNIYPAQEGSSKVSSTPPTPITYLTQWKIVGNSKIHGNEIWSCGEYNATDGKYHILVQPSGGSIADIALNEPLRKVNDVADSIEFPSSTPDKALVIRNLGSQDLGKYNYQMIPANDEYRAIANINLPNIKIPKMSEVPTILCALYKTISSSATTNKTMGIALSSGGRVVVYDYDYNQADSANAFKTHIDGVELIYELATPTTELIDAPQIEEAESYSMVISQGGKAVEWSSFETE
jgi:hypothetical protein